MIGFFMNMNSRDGQLVLTGMRSTPSVLIFIRREDNIKSLSLERWEL